MTIKLSWDDVMEERQTTIDEFEEINEENEEE